jgi:hypothetical protein
MEPGMIDWQAGQTVPVFFLPAYFLVTSLAMSSHQTEMMLAMLLLDCAQRLVGEWVALPVRFAAPSKKGVTVDQLSREQRNLLGPVGQAKMVVGQV